MDSSKNFYHFGCAFNLHSIINSGLILEVKNLSNRQKAFCLHVDPMNRSRKDLDTIDLAPLHNTRIKHGRDVRTQCNGSTSTLLRKKGLKTQPTPIVKDRDDLTCKNGRNTSRSQEIKVNSFCEELSFFRDETEKSKHVHLKTTRVSMSNRLQERGDLLLLLTRLKGKTALEYVLLMKADDEVLRERMENSIADHDESLNQ